MLHELNNASYLVKISANGAEMHSVFSKDLGREILWQADPAVWARHAPVLFPIVGRLKNDSYTYNDCTYSLPQHGFARDKEFRVIENMNTSITFELTEDEDTLKQYPFPFVLRITYLLDESVITCRYSVHNPSGQKMYFSIGAHPAFLCPLFDGERLEDYCIEFEREESSPRYLLQNGLLTDQEEKVIDRKTLPLKKELFDKDAIVLAGLESDIIKLRSDRYLLLFTSHNMPYFGIWTKKDSERFICLEPWAGVTDHVNCTGRLEEKKGIICLEGHQQYDCSFSFKALSFSAE